MFVARLNDVKSPEKSIFDIEIVKNVQFEMFWQILEKKFHFENSYYL